MNICIIMRPKCEPSGYAIHFMKNGTIEDTVGKNSRCKVRICYECNKKRIYLYKGCNKWISEQSGEE